MAGEAEAVILVVLAIIFPPSSVAMQTGCGSDFCINFLLTLLAWFPGCVHAFWLIVKRSEANETYGYKNWTYEGMGKYRPRGEKGPNATYYTTKAPDAPQPSPQKPASQAPVEQKAVDGPAEPQPAPADQKSAPPEPTDQKQSPAPAPQAPPTDQTDTGSTAPQSSA